VISLYKQIHLILSDKQRRKAVLLLVLMLIGTILEVLSIGIVLPLVTILSQDDVITKYELAQYIVRWMGDPSRTELLFIVLVITLLIFTIKNIFLAIYLYIQNSYIFGITEDLSYKMFKFYLYQPYTFHLQHNSSKLIQNITYETELFTNGVLMPAMILTSELLVALSLVSLLFYNASWSAVLAIVLLVGGGGVFYRIIYGRLKEWGKRRQYHEGMRIKHIKEGLSGIKDTIVFGVEKYMLSIFSNHNSGLIRVHRNISIVQQWPRLWIELMVVLGFVTIVGVLVWQQYLMEDIVVLLALFAAAAFRLMPSANRIMAAIQQIRSSSITLSVLQNELLWLKRFSYGKNRGYSNKETSLPWKELKLKNISYIYPDSTLKVLENIDIDIEYGQMIGFIGQSGAGKSTLVDVILGLLDSDGEVLIDNVNILDNLRSWQDQIGYIPQSIYLLDDSIKNNIAFGIEDSNISSSSINAAIKGAQLESFINELPDGIETRIGEDGVRLSGGQRQRLGIARALYHNPRILVLDEATSSLDTNTEDKIIKAINKLRGQKTILIIAHRMSTIQYCDVVYKIENGSIYPVENYKLTK